MGGNSSKMRPGSAPAAPGQYPSGMMPPQFAGSQSQWQSYGEPPVVPPAPVPERRSSAAKVFKSALKKSRGFPGKLQAGGRMSGPSPSAIPPPPPPLVPEQPNTPQPRFATPQPQFASPQPQYVPPPASPQPQDALPPGFVPTPSPQPMNVGGDPPVVNVLPPNFVPNGMPAPMPPPGSAIIPPRMPPVFTPGGPGPSIHAFTPRSDSSTSPEPSRGRTQTPFPREAVPLTESETGSESSASTQTRDYRAPSRVYGVPPPPMFAQPAQTQPPIIPQSVPMPQPSPAPPPPSVYPQQAQPVYPQPMQGFVPQPQPPAPESTQSRHRSRRNRRRSDQPDAQDLLRHPYSPQPEGAPVYGPGITVPARAENPLPDPPRDLYEFSPWKRLVGLPTTEFLMREGWQRPDVDAQLPPDHEHKHGGFLRAFGKKNKRSKNGSDAGGVRYVPVFPDRIQEDAGAMGAGGSTSGHGHTRSHSDPPDLENLTRGWTHNFVQPRPGGAPTTGGAVPPPGRAAIYFTQSAPYPGWMQHSPHRVLYNGIEWPTAHHLYESFRFEGREDIQRMIRAVPAAQTNEITMRYQAMANPMFDESFIQRLDEVLYLKFTQHPDLALQLLGTGDAWLVYNDLADAHWGNGPDGSGRNEFGQALMRLRDRLSARQGGGVRVA
ncbi:hypothetical protein K523DRAFT_284491 [Schizophyllum commune Tattone D]|nr:hypothetical protein K523DRAFT_284491 [Schizophyllum commune Tattone D]